MDYQAAVHVFRGGFGMKKLVVAAFLAVTVAAPVGAQELLGGYFAMLDYQDMRNSKGVVLGDFCAVVQQDRANWHKFGIRQQYDEGDPWFTSLQRRQVISGNCFVAAGSEYIPNAVLRGEPRFVRVQVFGRNGVPQWVEVHEGAG